MDTPRSKSPMRIELSEERRKALMDAFRRFFAEEFDEPVSDFRAGKIFSFFLRALGPPLYNQAVSDARAFMLRKLEDLDVEFYVPEGAP